MASSQKKNAVARAVPAPIASAPDEALAPPRAAFVMRASEDAETGPRVADDTVAEPVEEIQQSLRSALEKGVVESHAVFIKTKIAADETASAFEVSFAAARDGALAINAKAFEALRVNVDASFDFLNAAFAAKSLSDLVTLQTEFARNQVETIANQTRDFSALAQKAMADAAEPLKEQAARSFKVAV
jgi:phasin